MSYFKVKMHQIRFRLGLRARPRSDSSERFPRPPRLIWGVLLLKKREWKRGGRKKEEGKGGKRGRSNSPPFPPQPNETSGYGLGYSYAQACRGYEISHPYPYPQTPILRRPTCSPKIFAKYNSARASVLTPPKTWRRYFPL